MTDATEAPAQHPVLYSVADGVAHLELNRPEAFNSLSIPLADAFTEAVERAGADDEVKVVLLTGRGRAFCGGGDVKFMAASDSVDTEVRALADAAHRGILALAALSKPVIGAVHGSVAGGGIGLTCATDVLLAGDRTKFVAAYAGIAVTPDCSVSWALPRIVGERRALQFTLLNQVLDAETARDWGLVSEVHPEDEVLAAGRALAERLAASPAAVALGGTRRLVRDSADRTLQAHLEVEAETIAGMVVTEEAQALVRAFAAR